MTVRNLHKSRHLLVSLLFLACSFALNAQEGDDNRFGGWHFMEVSHKFGESPWSVMAYFEHENFQYKRLDCWYLRANIGYKPLPWLSTGIGYDYLQLPSTYGHRLVCNLSGVLREGNLSVTVRFRYLHTWKPVLHTQDNELRTLLRVAYSLPELRITPYMAVEVFTWGAKWKRSRHYIACAYDITKHMQIEGFYMLTFSSQDPQHILGLGMNFNI